MSRIIKWLKENGIAFTESTNENSTCKYITIILEQDCIWINGYNEEMHYDKAINIVYSKSYKFYNVIEKTGYSLSKTLVNTSRSDVVIDTLSERLLP